MLDNLNVNPKVLKSVNQLAALNAANIEKLAELQIEGLEQLTKAGIVSLKKAADVKDLEGAQAYVQEQAAALRVAGENAATRSKVVVDITKAYGDEVKAIVEKVVAA